MNEVTTRNGPERNRDRESPLNGVDTVAEGAELLDQLLVRDARVVAGDEDGGDGGDGGGEQAEESDVDDHH